MKIKKYVFWGASLLPLVFAMLILGPYRYDNYFDRLIYPLKMVGPSADKSMIINDDGCVRQLKWHALEKISHGLLARFDNDECKLATISPWFIDYNHDAPTGIGPINVLLVSWIKSYSDRYGLPNYGYDDSRKPLNILDGVLRIRYETQNMNDGSSIHFWIQAMPSIGRASNFMHSMPLDSDNGVHDAILSLNADNFICLGSSLRRARTYGCDMSVSSALSNVNVDFGFIRVAKDGALEGQSGARFAMNKFSISK